MPVSKIFDVVSKIAVICLVSLKLIQKWYVNVQLIIASTPYKISSISVEKCARKRGQEVLLSLSFR